MSSNELLNEKELEAKFWSEWRGKKAIDSNGDWTTEFKEAWGELQAQIKRANRWSAFSYDELILIRHRVPPYMHDEIHAWLDLRAAKPSTEEGK